MKEIKEKLLTSLTESSKEMLFCQHSGLQLPDVGIDLQGFIAYVREKITNEEFLLRKGDRFEWLITSPLLFHHFYSELEQFGAVFLGHGYFRVAFRVGEQWVVKSALHPDFYDANDSEFRFLDTLEDRQKKKFPEMYDLGEGIMLQKLYRPDRLLYSTNASKIRWWRARLKITDVHEENVGFDDKGDFRFIDFSTPDVMKPLLEKRRRLL